MGPISIGMDPKEYQLRIIPLIDSKKNPKVETAVFLKPNPRPCDYCDQMVDRQVTHIFRKYLANEAYTYKKCANCHIFIEKKLVANK